MNSIKKIYQEVCDLKPVNMTDLISIRLDLILNMYINELSESHNSLMRYAAKEDLYKELSKTKWMRH